jgi:hypothetical protein
MEEKPKLDSPDGQLAWDDLRTSPAFPAIIGGLAGALGGLVLVVISNRLRAPKQALPAAYDANGNPMNVVYLPSPQTFRILGFTPGDLIALATVGVSLYRQAQAWKQENELKQAALELSDEAALPPVSSQLPPAQTIKK